MVLYAPMPFPKQIGQTQNLKCKDDARPRINRQRDHSCEEARSRLQPSTNGKYALTERKHQEWSDGQEVTGRFPCWRRYTQQGYVSCDLEGHQPVDIRV